MSEACGPMGVPGWGQRAGGGDGMVSSRDIWRSDAHGRLRAEAHGFELVVLMANADASAACFRVMRRGHHGEDLVGSGQAESVRAAMKAAVEMAERFARPPQKELG
jgi:hypothetical protein